MGSRNLLFGIAHEFLKPRPSTLRMDIRLEESADQAAIHALHAQCFPTSAEARLVDALRVAGSLSISLVALDPNQIVGHVAFSPVTLDPSMDGLGLAPVAVLTQCRRRGIAAQLIRDGLALCKSRGIGFVVVLGSTGYYPRFGFEPASRWALRDEYGGGDAFQALELDSGAIPAGGGIVRYAPEFAQLD